MPRIDVDRIIARSKELKSSQKFNEESERLRKLLQHLKKSKNNNLNSILAEWIIIKLVILWEYHFKSIVIELIDLDDFVYKEDITASLEDLKKIQKTDQISAGRIFVSMKNFQNFETVIEILSKLTGRSFLKEIKEMYEHEIDVKSVKECLDKRHTIIHEMKTFEFTKQEIEKYAYSMMLFLINSSLYTNSLSQGGLDQPVYSNQTQSDS